MHWVARGARVWAKSILIGAIALTGFLAPSVSSAWVETRVLAQETRVDIDRTGPAIVTQELLLKVRGGPVRHFDVEGVGLEITPRSDATIRSALQGSSSQWPIGVEALEDGTFRLKFGGERGLRGGSYLLRFSYEWPLELHRSVETGDRVKVAFVGPRIGNGIDSAKLTFSVPKGSVPPTLVPSGEKAFGAPLLVRLRQGERDELDLVRAHIATGEPALWEIEIARDALDTQPISLDSQVHLPSPEIRRPSPLGLGWREALVLLTGFLLALLTGTKARALGLAASELDVELRPFLPGPVVLRVICVALGAIGFGWFGTRHQLEVASIFAAFAICWMCFLMPIRRMGPRGPGIWHPVPAETSVVSERSLPGKLFDVGHPSGFSFLLLLVGAAAISAFRLLSHSVEDALLVFSSVLFLIPLFFTGRRADFPESPLTQGRTWARYLGRKLRGEAVEIEIWGRYPLGTTNFIEGQVDEARVRLNLTREVRGLRALEVAIEEGSGRFVMPCVVVRVVEASEAETRLPSDLPWTRGRNAEERVAIVRPTVPTPRQLLRLVRALIVSLDKPSATNSSIKSAGKGETTSGGTVPAHSM